MKKKKLNKICLISSSGGHLTQTYALSDWWTEYERVWITRNDNLSQNLLKNEIVYYAHFPEQRNIANFLKNLFTAYQILKKEKPDLIFSTGAGVALPFFIVARILKIRTIFMETFIFIDQPTLTGRLIDIFRLADLFLVQNKNLLKQYPQAKYIGSIT
ncbi:MAG: PssD/Cps14F family polysaccharide biosynthesis glycosyltransferase [Patescibacteria group bacterium]|nr:PssD/Cps14F family polysaccharide biosynthesis glycosyltransferase [Patescibacteria group bacterium]